MKPCPDAIHGGGPGWGGGAAIHDREGFGSGKPSRAASGKP